MGMLDSLQNFVAQMGTSKSKMVADQFTLREMTAPELTAMYRSDWLGRKIIDAPVFDMFREWRSWQAEAPLVKAMEDAEKRWRVRDVLAKAVRLGRLYGGGAILIGANRRDPLMPLMPASIAQGGLQYLTAVSRFELIAGEVERDVRSQDYGKPKWYTATSAEIGNVRIHPSRVLTFIGADRLDPMLSNDGWGDSVLAAIYDTVHHAALAQTGVAELIHEAKVDVIKIQDLGAHLATADGTNKLTARFAQANVLKSINNMLLLNSGEEWDRKQTSFAGLPDVLDRYLQIVAGASDIPATRLLGAAAKGLNATGEGDLRNYYDMISSQRDHSVTAALERLDQILWLDAIGRVPPKAYYEWRPMWQLGEKEQADIAKTKAETTQIYLNAGILNDEALGTGVLNQIVEDGIYPGLEEAIAELRSKGVDPIEDPTAQNDNPEADRPEPRHRIGPSARA
jgi:phage-related protein (TIGR01555 family)